MTPKYAQTVSKTLLTVSFSGAPDRVSRPHGHDAAPERRPPCKSAASWRVRPRGAVIKSAGKRTALREGLGSRETDDQAEPPKPLREAAPLHQSMLELDRT